MTMDEINRVIDTHGITRQNITNILDESVDVLNHLLSGANECGQRVDDLRPDYKCFVSYDRSVIEFRNDYLLEILPEKMCAEKPDTPGEEMIDCKFNPSPNNASQWLYEWADADLVDFDLEDLDSDYLFFNSTLGPAHSTDGLNQEPPDPTLTNISALYELALEKSAAGDITIICRNPDLSISDYQELRFRIKFRNRYMCDPPDDEPDWDNEPDLIPVANCAGGGGGGPSVCPDDTPFGVPCAPDNRSQDPNCPIDFICVQNNSAEFFGSDNLFLCAEYINQGLEWHYPGADERCEEHTCALCGHQAMCDAPAAPGTGCSTSEHPNGRIGQCVVLQCDGSAVGEAACVHEVPNNARCGSGDCRGICHPVTGACDYSQVNQNTCTRTFSGGCTLTGGICINGQCDIDDPPGVCCAGDFCNPSRPYCCGGSYCSSDPTCPVPS